MSLSLCTETPAVTPLQVAEGSAEALRLLNAQYRRELSEAQDALETSRLTCGRLADALESIREWCGDEPHTSPQQRLLLILNAATAALHKIERLAK